MALEQSVANTLITHYDPKSPVAEAFRTLRTNIQFASPDKEIRTLLLTSAGPSEGKSMVIANLGIVLAQAGQKVIFVDADMRKPTVHERFKVSQTPGLTNVLLGKCALTEALQDVGIPGLSVLTSGVVPPNPSELLGSKAMDNLLLEMKGKADIVLFDAPPIVAVTDAAVVAPKLDGVLLLIRVGETPRQIVGTAKTLLENVKANILGVVLNGVSAKKGYGYCYYYYHQDE